MKKISGISFSYAENSLQARGLSLVDHFLGFKALHNLKHFSIPLCSSNKPDGEVPPGVQRFDDLLAESDALVFAVSEAGGHYCAAFKNVMDWLIVKYKFNSQLGAGYSLSGKPVYVFTFTPTHAGSGDRHFAMTKYLLAEKFGADVRQMFVLNRSWENILPGNFTFVKNQCETILEDLSNRSNQVPKPQADGLPKYDVAKWLREYENWDRQWTE